MIHVQTDDSDLNGGARNRHLAQSILPGTSTKSIAMKTHF